MGTDFTRRDWLLLLAAFVCAFLFAFCQPCLFDVSGFRLPGLGVTLSTFAYLGVGFFHIGRKSIHLSRQCFFLTVSAILLALSFSIFANESLRLMNLPVLAVLALMALRSASRGTIFEPSSRIGCQLICYIKNSFKSMRLPGRAIIEAHKNRKRSNVSAVWIGLAITLPILAIVIVLLAGADSVFSSMLENMFSDIDTADICVGIWRLVKGLVIFLLSFGVLYASIVSDASQDSVPAQRKLPTLAVLMPLAALVMLLGLFDYIQCRYLFGNAGTALLKWNYAQYARSGFFQLVIVAAISMSVVFFALCRHKESMAVRLFSVLLSLLTGLLTVSAARRMQLYVIRYGFTLLRAVTLWGIFAIAMLIVAALTKAARPKLRVRGALFAAIIVSWLALNYLNVDARIIEYNINVWQHNAQRALDTNYVRCSLSPDALPALRKLAESNDTIAQDVADLEKYFEETRPVWYDWSLSWTKL